MEIKKHYAVNVEEAEFGKWFNLEEGGRVKVARLGNRRFKAEVQRLQKENVTLLRVDRGEALDKITTRAMSTTILLDWEEFTLDGTRIEYTPENSLMLLESFPDFREAISQIAAEKDSFALTDIAGK